MSEITLILDKHCKLCKISATDASILVDTKQDWALCDTCIQLFQDGLEGSRLEEKNTKTTVPYSPKDIVQYLDEYIVGQSDAKKTLALAAYQHYKKMTNTGTMKFSKSNVLLLGPTGSGKTALIERLADFLDVPFVVYDATQLTETGYIGDDIPDVLNALYKKADGDLIKAQKGIVCIDEVDKIHRQTDGRRDVGGGGVQRMLLKTLESNIIQITKSGSRRSSAEDSIDFDTTNVLFIGTGAFSDLPDLIKLRLSKAQTNIGFSALVKNKDDKLGYDDAMKELDTDDLVEYGFMPEFLGRFPNISRTDSITPEIMERILEEPKDSALKQVVRLFALDGVVLSVEGSAKKEISRLASEHKTGARALKGILNSALKDIMFDYPSNIYIKEIDLSFSEDKFQIITRG
ncbi:ClpX ATP-dependent protease Clp, ATPase subunit [uncultured Caudovirales phage]|uniref:ClpX ATP-dependent protease Clp, ATPase subunit n=1 Tax=uncultured Caudovirales phage TaxID=2100421 RepID=A0A6J7XDD1_9CAUD|nr:ClpX ATP-dependent protease Clp, ATPase subunit [uncultured Caudovirales phage]CAB5228130.1 ClpX ATP-dependent protease Clp, ATPase subunit [uncultured Caudovirales phage]